MSFVSLDCTIDIPRARDTAAKDFFHAIQNVYAQLTKVVIIHGIL